ncbi:transposable element Tcb2 transposase [Trichonephila clavipes]|nr:transposable element Tcb2 transposase [Trichonephila clavipes]
MIWGPQATGAPTRRYEFKISGPTSTEQLEKLVVDDGRLEDRRLLYMAVNEHTASSSQLAAHWSTATDVLMSSSSIRRCMLHRGLRARVPLYRIHLTTNHQWLRLLWAHEQSLANCLAPSCLFR